MAQLIADYQSDHHRRKAEGKFLEVASSGDLHRLNKIANSLPLQMIGVNTIHKALLLAARNGHANVVQFLLAYTIISPKYKISLMGSRISVHASPIFAAVKEGHLEVVRALVNHILPAYKFNPILAASNIILPCNEINAEAHQQWLQGLVQWAVRWGHVSIVVFLVDKYQKLFNPQLVDVMALTLHLAAYHNHVDVLKVILESNCPETVHQFMPFMSDDSCKNIATSLFSRDGLTALHLSAQTGCLRAVDMLITKLDDMTVVSDPELFTPLHLAANFGHVQVVKYMLDRCTTAASNLGGERAGVHDVIVAKDYLGRTALHYAAREGHAEVVRQLVAAGLAGRTNIACIADYDGLLALHMAARSGHVEVIQILKAFGGIGTTVRHSIEVKTWVEREYYMEQQGRSMDHPGSQMAFCLGKEWKFPRMKFFDALFWRTDGFSPLHFAARYGHIEALQELLKETGAEDDQNPLFLADRGGFLAYDWMQVQGLGEDFLACVAPGWGSPYVPDLSEVGKFQYLREELEKRSFSRKNMQRADGTMEQEIRADIAEERTAMHELRRAWQNIGHRIEHIPMQVLQWLVEDEEVDYPSWQGRASTRFMTPAHFGATLIQALGKANFLAAKEILCLPGADFTLDAKNIGNRLKETLRGIKVSAPHDQIMNSHESSTLRFLEDFLMVLVTRKEMMGCARWLARWARKNHLDSLLGLILGQPEVRRRLFEDRQLYVDCANALLVGAALIAGVAFQGWLQPPLGFSNEYEGIGYAYVHERAMRAFWWMNNGAFFCSVAALIAGATGAVPVTVSTDTLRAWEKVTRAVGVASFFLSMALICVVGAFSAAGFAALPPFASDVNNIMKAAVIWGTSVCGLMLVWFTFGVSPLVILAIRFVARVLIFALSHSDRYITTAQDQQHHGPLDAAKRIAATLSGKLVRRLRAVVEFEPSYSPRD